MHVANEGALLSVVKPQSVSLVDTIGMGYRAINRRPWVIGIPAGVSAYLWLATPLPLAAVAGAARDGLGSAARLISGPDDGQAGMVQEVLLSGARLMVAWLNLVPVHMPAELTGEPAGLGGPLQLIGSVAAVNTAALLLSGLFLSQLGQAVGEEHIAPRESVARGMLLAGHIALYLLALLGVGLILGLPFLAISAIVIATLPGAAVPILAAWYVALFWAYVYTGFAPEAILISRVGPLRAIYKSVNIVRRNLLPTLGLLLISFVIVSGLGVIWRQISGSPAGLIAAILGSAYVGSGLCAARLQFYRERLGAWRGR